MPAKALDQGRAVAILRAGQRAVIRATEEAELLSLICAIAVNEAGYRMAWAGLADDDADQTIRPIATAGEGQGYLDAVPMTWSDTSSGYGPAGTAVRDNRPALARDFTTDPALAPWKRQAERHGFRSAIALPLRTQTVPFGVFVIYSAEPDDFSANDVEVLGSLAEDLAFGMNTLRSRSTTDLELRRSERSLAEAQRVAHIGSWEWDLVSGVSRRSDELHRIYGVEPGTIAETTEAFLAFVHPDDRDAVRAAERAALESGARYETQYRGVRPDGTIRVIRDQAEVIRDADGAPIRMIGTVQDITDQLASDADRATLVAAVEQTADAVWIKDVDGIVTYANQAFSRVYGYEPGEVIGRFAGIVDSGRHPRSFFDAIWDQASAGKTWSGTIVNRRKDGEFVELEAVISGIRDPSGRTVAFMQTDRDVTRERALEVTIGRLARERSIIEAAVSAIDSDSTPEAIAAVACGEMIRMPVVDAAFVIALDTLGHGLVLGVAGAVASVFSTTRILPMARSSYLFERASAGTWTEDWQARPEDGAYGLQIAEAGIRTVAYAPMRGPSGLIGVVGIGIHNRDRAAFIEQLPVLTTLGTILGSLVAPGLDARFSENAARARTQGILDGRAFRPFFQPIAELRSGTVVGYEALSRFDDGVPPDLTFALAQRCGLGVELEAATLRAAIEASSQLAPEAYLSLNVSPALIASGSLGALIEGAGRSIVLEITEHEAIDDYPNLRRMLAELGPAVRIAVDDAGAGYASMRHILELAPAYVKLDIRLIRGIDADPARQALIAGVGYFAMKRKLRLIAEGIETTAELETLRGLGVALGQGYLLGRPQAGLGPDPWPASVPVPATTRPQDAIRS